MLPVARGTGHALFVYDIAFSVDLSEAERRISSAKRETLKHKRRAPRYFQYTPAPLSISQEAWAVRLQGFATDPQVELVVYDFGAVSVIYRIALRGDSPSL